MVFAKNRILIKNMPISNKAPGSHICASFKPYKRLKLSKNKDLFRNHLKIPSKDMFQVHFDGHTYQGV